MPIPRSWGRAEKSGHSRIGRVLSRGEVAEEGRSDGEPSLCQSLNQQSLADFLPMRRTDGYGAAIKAESIGATTHGCSWPVGLLGRSHNGCGFRLVRTIAEADGPTLGPGQQAVAAPISQMALSHVIAGMNHHTRIIVGSRDNRNKIGDVGPTADDHDSACFPETPRCRSRIVGFSLNSAGVPSKTKRPTEST